LYNYTTVSALIM